MARVPVRTVSLSDRERLAGLEQELKAVIFGQDRAVEGLASAIKLSRAGLGSAERPVGSFLFSGPTGVGKTELARQLARVMGVELIRFDMSEYMEKHSVSRLIGAPPGYVGFDQGGLLTDAILKNPHAVLILDEIEKAHPDLFQILLQVMDHATLTDNNGRKADFRNVVLVMTTNAGAQELSQAAIGFGGGPTGRGAAGKGAEKAAIERTFSPEFRNRLDAWIAFDPLTPDVIAKVVDKQVAELVDQLRAKGVALTLAPAARSWLAANGYDERNGARPMARLIDRTIRRPLADEILFGKLLHGGSVVVAEREGRLTLDVKAKAEALVAELAES
jgi:ATP-dependent Clp protease ATP-binding subunit ClpA